MVKRLSVFLRAPGNYDPDVASAEAGLVCPEDESVTQQQFLEETDINTIVRRFGLTGELPDDFRAPVSGDFTGISDFQTAMQVVREAQESFMTLPGHVRARFVNDPQRLMDFLGDEGNRDEAVKMGLVKAPPVVVVPPVVDVPPK